jgi:hypothetical protein
LSATYEGLEFKGYSGDRMECKRAAAPPAQRPGAGKRKLAGEGEKHQIKLHINLHTRPKKSQGHIYG